MGRRRLCLLQVADDLPLDEPGGGHPAVGRLQCRHRPWCSASPLCGSRAFTWPSRTLAAQFFLIWLFEKWAWLYNYNTSGAIQVPNVDMWGITIRRPARIVDDAILCPCLPIVTLITLLCINLTRGNLGRMWKATRDMDIAAELIGINLMKSKLIGVCGYRPTSSGVAGALFVFLWRGAAEPNLFDITLSFQILFIAIIGGLRFDPWQLPRRDPDRRASGGPELAAPNSWGRDQVGDARTSEHHDHRFADRLLPDRRAAWPCAPVAASFARN